MTTEEEDRANNRRKDRTRIEKGKTNRKKERKE